MEPQRKRVFSLLLFSVLLAGIARPAYAIEVYRQGGKEVSLGLKMKLWYQSIQDAAPNGMDRSNDFALKAGALYLKGRYNKTVAFGSEFDWLNLGTVDGVEHSSATTAVHNAWVGFNFMPQLNFMTGKYRAAFSRYSLTSSATAYLFPHNPFSAGAGLVSSGKDYRQTGVTVWGFLWKRFRYDAGVASGVPAALKGNDSSGSLQYLFRAEYTPLGIDKGYFHKNEWLGEKGKFLTLGAGFIARKYNTAKNAFDNATYSAWTVDEYSEYPVGGGSLDTEAAYYYYNFDDPANPNVQAWYAQAGYLLPGRLGPGRLQPAVRFDTFRPKGHDTATKAWSAGLNYYIKGHNVEVQIEYLNISNEANASQNLAVFSGIKGKDADAVTVQLSFVI